MFSVKMKTRLAGLALVGALVAVPGAASAGVVVKSSGPSAGDYPVGRQVADTATIALRAGDKITVLTDSGTKVMQGPGSFRVGEGVTRTRARFSNLTRRNASTRSRTGAVRGTGEGAPRRPNLWLVDITASGTTCLYDFDRVRLWRPSASEAQTYTFTDQATNMALDVNFVGTEAMRALDPEGLKLTDGSSYTIWGPKTAEEASQEAGAMPSISVKFVSMPDDIRQPDLLAQALAERGCMTQLSLLGDVAEAEAQ